MRRISPWLALLWLAAFLPFAASAQEGEATTADDPDISLRVLEIRLAPLTVEELRVEAEAWQDRLREAVERLGAVELEVLAQEQETTADGSPPPEPEAEAEAAHAARQDRLRELGRARDETIERLEVVLDEITRKVGVDDQLLPPEDVVLARRYIAAVDDIHADIEDADTVLAKFRDWFTDPEGGKRWMKNTAIVLGFIVAFFLIGHVMARAINKGLSLSGRSSRMIEKFNRRNLPRFMLLVGFLAGLAALNVNITPLIALIGGASFIIAFALQDTLGNFASGVMIMLYKPFDEGDYVDVAGIQGTVKSMSMVNTTIGTVDNKQVVVPNNKIWGDVITNYTGVTQRRVDLVFGVGYDDDMDQVEALLVEAVKAHPKVLEDPEPVVKVHELADSSVNFVCRPWVKTEDYWEVYWDLTRAVKRRFDEAGISIPFPQRDVHLYAQKPDGAKDAEAADT